MMDSAPVEVRRMWFSQPPAAFPICPLEAHAVREDARYERMDMRAMTI